MSTKTNAKPKTTKAKKENLEALPLPKLWERFKEATGESTKSPNKKFLVKRINEALAARAVEPATTQATPPPARRNARAPEPTEATTEPEPTTASDTPKQPRGRFASMTIEELQAKYLEVVGRSTGSDDKRYLIWKIRQAQQGKVPVGPVGRRQPGEPPVEHKVLPLRMPAETVEALDDVWRRRGLNSRMDLFRHALDQYLTGLGEEAAAARVRSA